LAQIEKNRGKNINDKKKRKTKQRRDKIGKYGPKKKSSKKRKRII
jgi:hypothetical protein